jgi:hypothetical protein
MWFGRQRLDLVTMSERDLKRIEVLAEVLAGGRTVVSAAGVLALGVRQTFRLLARYKDGGGGVWDFRDEVLRRIFHGNSLSPIRKTCSSHSSGEVALIAQLRAIRRCSGEVFRHAPAT